jgi:hypothetical protein
VVKKIIADIWRCDPLFFFLSEGSHGTLPNMA